MPVVRTSFMMGCVVVEVTWTSGARPRRAASKSWLLQASTWARAMATAGDSCWADIWMLSFDAVTGLRTAGLDGGRRTEWAAGQRPVLLRAVVYMWPRGPGADGDGRVAW